MSIKFKPRGASICSDVVIFMYICSKPILFAIPDLSLSHSSKTGYPFGLHSGQYVATNSNHIFKRGKYKKIKLMRSPVKTTRDTSQKRGELGGIWEAFGGVEAEEASGKHLEGRSQIMCLTLEQNATSPLKFKLYDGVLMVPSIMNAYLLSDMSGGFSSDPSDRSRALYQL